MADFEPIAQPPVQGGATSDEHLVDATGASLGTAGNPLYVSGGGGGGGSNASVGTDASTAPTSATELGGIDGSGNLQGLKVDASTNLKVVDANSAGAKTDLDAINTATSGAKSDLDTIVTQTAGVATAANQTTANSSLSTIATNTTGVATQTTLAAAKSDLDSISANEATAANQATANASLSSIATNTSNTATVAGATGDASVVGDTSGTLSAKLRGLSKIWNSVWDSVNNLIAVNLKQVGATAYALGAATVANSLPITNAAVQGWISPTGSITSGQDNSLTFGSQVRKVVMYNASSQSVPVEFDATSSANSIPILPGQSWVFDDVLCTVVHVFPGSSLSLNQSGGLHVRGWK